MVPTATTTNYLALLVIVIAADLLLADETNTVSTTVDTSGTEQGGITLRTLTRLESHEEVVGAGGRAGPGSVVYRPYTHQDQRVYYQYPYQQPA